MCKWNILIIQLHKCACWLEWTIYYCFAWHTKQCMRLFEWKLILLVRWQNGNQNKKNKLNTIVVSIFLFISTPIDSWKHYGLLEVDISSFAYGKINKWNNEIIIKPIQMSDHFNKIKLNTQSNTTLQHEFVHIILVLFVCLFVCLQFYSFLFRLRFHDGVQ